MAPCFCVHGVEFSIEQKPASMVRAHFLLVGDGNRIEEGAGAEGNVSPGRDQITSGVERLGGG
jgi:hypothetical protein